MSDLANNAAESDASSAPTLPEGGPRERSVHPPERTSNRGQLALALLPGALTLYLSFSSGGFFAGTTGLIAAALGVALVLRITLAAEPFAGLGRPAIAAIAALGLLAAWTLASGSWSESIGRAVIEFDRTLMYALLILLMASVRWSPRALAWALRALAMAIVAVAGAALVSRVLPDVLPTTTLVENSRLSYPLTYWNALGLQCGLGIVLCAHITSDLREHPVARALAAGALPVLAAALYFSFSRGGIAAAAGGVILYVLLARPAGLPAALIAAAPTVTVALIAAYRADLLASDDPTTRAAVAQGHEVAAVVAGCVLVATGARLVLGGVDRRLSRLTVPRLTDIGPAALGAGGAGLAAVVLAAVALGGSGWIGDRIDSLSSNEATESGDLRNRFSSVDNNGRMDQWRVALSEFRAAPAVGAGAGAFGQAWARERDGLLKVEDAHSLYLETLAELGAVGFVLLAVALFSLAFGVARQIRGDARAVHAAVFACLLAWLAHAGIDWDWEMPAVTVGVLAVAAMSQWSGTTAGVGRPGHFTRVLLGIGCLALVPIPAAMALSQRSLDASVEGLKRGDCTQAIDDALAAARVMPVRPEPFAVLGYCDMRLGKDALAIQMLEAAIERDPSDWQHRYGLALVLAASGHDPRPQLRAAVRLNPREPLLLDARYRLRGSDPNRWQRTARVLPLPIL